MTSATIDVVNSLLILAKLKDLPMYQDATSWIQKKYYMCHSEHAHITVSVAATLP